MAGRSSDAGIPSVGAGAGGCPGQRSVSVLGGGELSRALRCGLSDEARWFSIGTLFGTQRGRRLAVAAPAALDCALGLGQQLETMVEALREEHAEGDVPCGWAPGALM
ncbi:hypothetical protein MTO96_013062 [Rhipicephalus appendiculatus]